MFQRKPLTGTGMGVMLSGLKPGESLSTEFLEDLIDQYKFVVIKGFNRPLPETLEWMTGFGELVRNEKRVNETLLILDGQKEEKEVIGGKGRMPLHCDGLLMNEKVRLVAIYGVEFDLEEGGMTYISDNEAAWDRMPGEIKDALYAHGIEVQPCDTTYYIKNEPIWYRFAGVQSRNGRDYMNGGLHYHPDERASFRVRIADIPEDLSYKYFNRLEEIFHDPELTYYHQWEPGDLLLMDNVRTMHGRQAFSGRRNIAQFQIRNAN